MRICAAIFGDSERALRLPALAGAALYFLAIYRLALIAFGDSMFFFLAVALVSLNPFVLDFMVAARGYGMALAFLMVALALLLETFESGQLSPQKLAWAGAALALSVTANLIFVLPAAALAGLAFVSLRSRSRLAPAPNREKRRKKGRKQQGERAYGASFFAPIGVIAVLFVVLAPIDAIRLEDLYTVASTISASLRSMATVALLHSGPLRKMDAMNLFRDLTAFRHCTADCNGSVRDRHSPPQPRVALDQCTPSVRVDSFGSLTLCFRRPYPEDRTGIYFAPLVSFSLVALACWAKGVSKFMSAALVGLGVFLILCFLTEFDVRSSGFGSMTRIRAQSLIILRLNRDPSAATVRVGGSWQLTESM